MLAIQTRVELETCRSCWIGARVAVVCVMFTNITICPRQATRSPIHRRRARGGVGVLAAWLAMHDPSRLVCFSNSDADQPNKLSFKSKSRKVGDTAAGGANPRPSRVRLRRRETQVTDRRRGIGDSHGRTC